MLPEGVEVRTVSRRGSVAKPARGHVRAIYTAEVTEPGREPGERLELAVEGAGLGLFGRHSVAIARALEKGLPTVFGFDDGLIYRQWLDGPPTELSRSDPGVVAAIADYASRRHQALPTQHDRSRELAGEQPVWEVASMILSSSLGRGGVPLRPLVVDPLARSLLAVEQPSVIDGQMGAKCWFRPLGSDLLKADFATAAFSNLDLACYDPIFDLAGASLEMEDAPGGARMVATLRRCFEEASGLRVDDERWLLYHLVHLWNAHRIGRMTASDARSASSRAVHRYLAQVYLADIPVPTDGPLCAIDIDGVLETEALGFSATTSSGALALRALRAHGYRVVLATGRCLGDVVDRCRAFDLAGGVAEYGSAVYVSATGSVIDLLSPENTAAVGSVHEWLEPRAELDVDPRYRRITRVRLLDGDRGRSVPASHLDSLPEPAGGSWQFVVGEGQTDIVVPGIDKGVGLRALAERLQPSSTPPLELAVGDTESDMPMLRLARRPFAPANASRALRDRGVPLLRYGYQRGLVESVGQLTGHAPGACRVCAPLSMSPERKRLLQLLSVQEAGGRGMPRRIGALTWGVATRGLLR
jgi:hypothetical protein